MTPEDAFLLDILSNPDDPAPRLIYADWLLDQDDPRAASIRRGCEILAAPSGSHERRVLREAFRLKLDDSLRDLPEVEGLVLTWTGLVSVFRYRLAEVMTWCKDRGVALRSPELHPDANPPHGKKASSPSSISTTNWAEMVQRVCLRRTRRFAQLGQTPRWLADDLAKGCLLVYFPATAERMTVSGDRTGMHYLDDTFRPAWDTWLVHGREPRPDVGHQPESYLIAWVPPALLVDVDSQMELTGVPCLRWADEVDRPLIHHLREAGLLS